MRKLEGFDKLMKGVKAGDKRTAEVTLSKDAPNAELRGKKVDVEFEVLEVKKLKLPELTRRIPAGNRRLRDRRRAPRRDSQESRAAAGISAAADRPQPDFGAAHQERRLGAAAGPACSGKVPASWSGP